LNVGPLDHALAFWKPVGDPQALLDVGRYCAVGERVSRRVSAWRVGGEPARHRVVYQGSEFALFAAVHPIASPPPAAEVVAEILDEQGRAHSYVLWFPEEQSVVIPFDSDSAVEAMGLEKYVPESEQTVLPKPLLSAYYRARSAVPPVLRAGLRKVVTRKARAARPFLNWPSDRSTDLLLRLLLQLTLMALGQERMSFVWFWPHRRRWAAVLTHDVETARGLARIPRVMALEQARNLRSSFNLVPRDYEIPGSLLGQISDAQFEVGVHGYTHDGLLFSSWPTFLDRVGLINECGRRWGAAGFRSPATYRNPEWFHLLEFEYDSSMADTSPYEPQPGGCGSWFPYRIGEIVEVPITVPQDHTLFSVLGQSDHQGWLSKLAEIRDANAMACMLTHPDPGKGYLGDNEAHYDRALQFIAQSDAWTPLPRDLVGWWRTRESLPLGRGEGTDGASLGLARLNADGQLEIVASADRS
jgi:hypothetical protein